MGAALGGTLAASLGGLTFAAFAEGFLRVADAAKKMEAQLRLATDSFGTFGRAQADVERIADVTRSGLTETASLYGNFIRASKESGRSQADAARATESFAKALKIGGAGAQEAASATLQFGQALASGVLRGDEFNSIAEASPRIMRLLADSLKVSTGELRSLAQQGKLTRDVLFNALLNGELTKPLDAEFERLPVTFGEAMTALSNAGLKTFGAFDRGGQFSDTISQFVLDSAKKFGDLDSSAEDLGVSIRATFGGLSDAFSPMLDGALSVFGSIESQAKSTRDIIAQLLEDIDQIRNAGKTVYDFVFGGNAEFRKKSGYKSPWQTSRMALDFSEGFDRRVTAAEAARIERDRRDILSTWDIPGWGSKPSSVAASSSGKKGRSGRSRKAEIDDISKSLDEAWIRANNLYLELNKVGFADADKVAADHARSFYSSLGIDPRGDLRDIIGASDKRRELEMEANQRIAEDFHRRMADQTQTLANLYEDAFRGGTQAIWRDFKSIGLRIIAEVLAKFTIAQMGGGGGFSLGGALSSAIGHVLPGFAGGGLGTIGGIGGTDNNVLSLNGRPFARVSRGENLSIENKALRGAHNQPQAVTVYVQAGEYFDARVGKVSGPVAAQVVRQAAPAIGAQAVKTALKMVPGRMAQYQNDGT